FLRRTRAAVPDADVLVIDDNSPDGTAEIAKAVGATLGRIDVLHRPRKEGLGAAYTAGFAEAIARGYDAVCYLDADLSHDPAAIAGMLDRLEADDAALVIGSRYIPGGSIPHWSWFRRLLSRAGNLYAGLALATGVRDSTSGCRAYRTSAL